MILLTRYAITSFSFHCLRYEENDKIGMYASCSVTESRWNHSFGSLLYVYNRTFFALLSQMKSSETCNKRLGEELVRSKEMCEKQKTQVFDVPRFYCEILLQRSDMLDI